MAGWRPRGLPIERRLGVITGTSPASEGKDDPVWAKLIRRVTDVVRLAGAVLQALYYGLKF
jgi:hypothetical protein